MLLFCIAACLSAIGTGPCTQNLVLRADMVLRIDQVSRCNGKRQGISNSNDRKKYAAIFNWASKPTYRQINTFQT